MIASLEAPEGSPMMTAFMPYLLLDNDANGRFQALIAAALFKKEPVRQISSRHSSPWTVIALQAVPRS
jgi:hypothetical protein